MPTLFFEKPRNRALVADSCADFAPGLTVLIGPSLRFVPVEGLQFVPDGGRRPRLVPYRTLGSSAVSSARVGCRRSRADSSGSAPARRSRAPGRSRRCRSRRRVVEVGALVLDLGDRAERRRSRARSRAGCSTAGSSRPTASPPTQRPKVGEPRRTSTATSKISPSMTRTSLPCGRRHLQVQAAQRAADRARVVVLDERPVDAGCAVLLGVVGLEEEAAGVAMHVGLDRPARRECRSGRRARSGLVLEHAEQVLAVRARSIARASRAQLGGGDVAHAVARSPRGRRPSGPAAPRWSG